MKGDKRTVRVLGYARVSTREQAEGVSVDEQLERIRAYCQAKGWRLVEELIDEGFSGKDLRRPALTRLRELVAGGEIDVLVVKKLDRLTRRQRDLWNLLEGEFEPHDVGLASVTEPFETCSAMGRAFLGMLGVFAQLERDTIAERTKDALAHKRTKGERVGAAPLGYRAGGGPLVPDDREQATLRAIAELRAQGHTLRRVADRLNRLGIPTKRGGTWHASTVSYLERNVLTRLAIAAAA